MARWLQYVVVYAKVNETVLEDLQHLFSDWFIKAFHFLNVVNNLLVLIKFESSYDIFFIFTLDLLIIFI